METTCHPRLALLGVYHDAPTAQGRGSGKVAVSHLIVVYDVTGRALPDLEPEPVNTPSARHLAVRDGQQEAVLALPLHRPGRAAFRVDCCRLRGTQDYRTSVMSTRKGMSNHGPAVWVLPL